MLWVSCCFISRSWSSQPSSPFSFNAVATKALKNWASYTHTSIILSTETCAPFWNWNSLPESNSSDAADDLRMTALPILPHGGSRKFQGDPSLVQIFWQVLHINRSTLNMLCWWLVERCPCSLEHPSDIELGTLKLQGWPPPKCSVFSPALLGVLVLHMEVFWKK